MSSRSGGKKKGMNAGAGSTGSVKNPPPKAEQLGVGGDGDNGCRPLESRTIEVRMENGNIEHVPALDKRWAPPMNYIEFYLPSHKTIQEDETALLTWLDYMEMYCKDLKWLLSVPHHQFWSVMVYCPEIPQVVLYSFLLRAPQWFDKEFQMYLDHDVIGPKYQDVYSLVFRVFMRLCTFKESKRDFISPPTWASLLADHQILDVLKLQSLCCLYDSENNALLPKMIENVMKNCPRLFACYRNLIPELLSKSEEMTDELKKRIRESSITHDWNPDSYEEILSFFLSTTCGIYKFAKVYPPAAEIHMKFQHVLPRLAATYDPNCCKVWGKVTRVLPMLEERVILLRILLIRLFRVSLASPTIMQVNSSNDQRIDEFFEVLTNCLDEKIFIRDYEKAYPFKQDINALLSRGVFIDETRIDYMANAISACFHACGEDYSVERIVVDPLYDPNFDRQLLGACSLDVTGVELQSLVTQVKDILPEIPDSYVEVVLKHYGYQAEVAINALLEGSVPVRLEKYKNESYVQPLSNASDGEIRNDVVPEDTALEKLASKLQIKDVGIVSEEAEKFYSGKRRHGFDEIMNTPVSMKEIEDLKPKIKGIVTLMEEGPVLPPNRKRDKGKKYAVEEETSADNYIDESLLPRYLGSAEYEDEYDDTYDELNVGMTEPDSAECKPLNQKQQRHEADPDDDDDENPDGRKLDQLYEDPAIVRARLERRREEKMQHHGHNQRRGGGPPPPTQDVVGKAKGQGQEKDVLYARRQKTANKDSGGYRKKRADFKRKEF